MTKHFIDLKGYSVISSGMNSINDCDSWGRKELDTTEQLTLTYFATWQQSEFPRVWFQLALSGCLGFRWVSQGFHLHALVLGVRVAF